MHTCKHCGQSVPNSHFCSVANKQIEYKDGSSDFLISAAIGYATNSAIIGGLVGGDFVGGAVGDFLNGDSLFD